MIRVIGVGDNTVDVYVLSRTMYPGGNAVNVPVLAHRYGHPASYLGWLGNDVHGLLIWESLKKEGVDISHCRLIDGQNAYCEVFLKDGDRTFGSYSSGVCDQIQLSDEDYRFIREYDLVHTSVYSFIEPQLKTLRKFAATLSFDFSQEWDRRMLERIAPDIDIALLSYPSVNSHETEELLRRVVGLGSRLAIATRGEHGALAFDGKRLYHQPIFPTHVVDTLGAGDAFSARFMVTYLSGSSV